MVTKCYRLVQLGRCSILYMFLNSNCAKRHKQIDLIGCDRSVATTPSVAENRKVRGSHALAFHMTISVMPRAANPPLEAKMLNQFLFNARRA